MKRFTYVIAVALLLATGAHPRAPDVPGIADHGWFVHTLDEAQSVEQLAPILAVAVAKVGRVHTRG
jgi:NADH dehydrogenase FAD-containing subunit